MPVALLPLPRHKKTNLGITKSQRSPTPPTPPHPAQPSEPTLTSKSANLSAFHLAACGLPNRTR